MKKPKNQFAIRFLYVAKLLVCLQLSVALSAQNISVGNSTMIVGAGTLILTPGSIKLTAGGEIDNKGIIKLNGNFTNNGNGLINNSTGEVQFSGASGQKIDGSNSTSFYNLTIDNSLEVTMQTNVKVSNTLKLTNGRLDAGNKILTLTARSIINGGTFSDSRMLYVSGTGEIRKKLSTIGSYLFPVGDVDSVGIGGEGSYAPVVLNFASGTFGPTAYVVVKTVKSKHPNDVSTANYLNRYWQVTQTGISSFNCNFSGTYGTNDVVGNELYISSALWNGSVWTKFSNVNANLNTVNASVTSFGDFGGISDLTCTTAPAQPSAITGPANVCGVNTANYFVTKVPGVTYTWTLRPGMSNPVYNAAGNSVTVAIDQNAGVALNGNIQVTATNGCGTSAASSRLINLIPGTPISLSGPNRLCGLTTATYSCPIVSGPGVTYIWSFPAGMTGNSTTNTVNVTMTGIANITGMVSVAAQNACGNNGIAVTKSVNSAPNALSAIAGPTNICSSSFFPSGVSKPYSVSALPANQYITKYTWSCNTAGVVTFSPNLGPNDNSTLAAFSSSYPATAIINVKAKNQCGVSAIKSITVNRSTSSTCTARPIVARPADASKESNLSSVTIYPNPSNGLFSVEFNSNSKYQNLKLEIVNLLGQKIYQTNITHQKSAINISSQQSGMYFMSLIDNSGTVVERRKLIKE